MLRAILNKSWKQHPTKQQLYGHLPPTTKTIQVRRTISDILLWTPSHERAKAGQPAYNAYKQQLCVDTGCKPEDLPEAMDDREGWRERVKDIPDDDDFSFRDLSFLKIQMLLISFSVSFNPSPFFSFSFLIIQSINPRERSISMDLVV